MEHEPVTPDVVAEDAGLADWRVVQDALHGHFRAGSFEAAASLVAAVAAAAEDLEHHPDVELRYPDHVRVVLITHETGGITNHDLDLARRISDIAGSARATAEPATPQSVAITIDTLDASRIRPFWAAVLGYRGDGDVLHDPLRLGPPVWFQQMEEPRTDRDRFHIDVTVPHDVARERIASALAAGGRLVSDRFAPSWWVLADADGNEACVCTWQGR